MRKLADLALELGLIYLGALGIPLIIGVAAAAFWREHDREIAVVLSVCGFVAAGIIWPPVITNIQECRALKSAPTAAAEYESLIYNGKRYRVPKMTKTADTSARIRLLEKHCDELPNNI